MSYDRIKADCLKSHADLRRIIRVLRQDLDAQPALGEVGMVLVDRLEAEDAIAFLDGIAGLLRHLGDEPDAAGALLRQHQPGLEACRERGAA